MRRLPYLLIVLALVRFFPTDWGAVQRIRMMEGNSAYAAWLSLSLANLVAAFLLFSLWFFMRRGTDKYLRLDSDSLRLGSNGRETEYPFHSLKGIHFRIGRFKRWMLDLEFAQGRLRISPLFAEPDVLLRSFFERIGKPLFGPEPIRREFLWRLVRTEILWKSFRKHWCITALASGAATWSGKMLADASPATDYRINLWLAFNFLLPLATEILINGILMRKWESRFRAEPSLEISLPPGYAASVYRKAILGAVLVYLVVYFTSLSDLILND
ncbi:MAG: hypothetical protein JF616_04240 [Fibrobacteres bacterium]|nr:hypothetical protein [Fibrobacterota bacterium]